MKNDKTYTEEDLQVLKLLQEDRKKTKVYFDLEIIVKARIVLLTWLKGIQSRDITENKKQALTSDLNVIGKALDSHTELEEKNFTFQRKIMHMEVKMEKIEESVLYQENIRLKKTVLDFVNQIETLGKQNSELIDKLK